MLWRRRELFVNDVKSSKRRRFLIKIMEIIFSEASQRKSKKLQRRLKRLTCWTFRNDKNISEGCREKLSFFDQTIKVRREFWWKLRKVFFGFCRNYFPFNKSVRLTNNQQWLSINVVQLTAMLTVIYNLEDFLWQITISFKSFQQKTKAFESVLIKACY
jgi:hypothetical protein